MPETVPPEVVDPGNAEPDQWSTPFTADELAALFADVDDPSDPIVVAGLAGTLYDPSGEVA